MDKAILDEYVVNLIVRRGDSILQIPESADPFRAGLRMLCGNYRSFGFGGLVYYPPTSLDQVLPALSAAFEHRSRVQVFDYKTALKSISRKTRAPSSGILEHFCDTRDTDSKGTVYVYHSFDFLFPLALQECYGRKVMEKAAFDSRLAQVGQLFYLFNRFEVGFQGLKTKRPKLASLSYDTSSSPDKRSERGLLLALSHYEFAALTDIAMANLRIEALAGMQEPHFYFLKPLCESCADSS